MRKSYYVVHKIITLCKKCITLCGNYYVMRKLLRYVASHTMTPVYRRFGAERNTPLYGLPYMVVSMTF